MRCLPFLLPDPNAKFINLPYLSLPGWRNPAKTEKIEKEVYYYIYSRLLLVSNILNKGTSIRRLRPLNCKFLILTHSFVYLLRIRHISCVNDQNFCGKTVKINTILLVKFGDQNDKDEM